MDDVKTKRVARRYVSPVREEAARRTRRAIVAAAGELFVGRGYAATSLADIAAAAGVARPTVFAVFGSKAAVLRQVLDESLAGDDEPVPVAKRSWFRPVWDATTAAEVLNAYARVCTIIGARSARIFEAVRRAADADPAVAELWSSLLNNRRAGAEMVIKQTQHVGSLRKGVRIDRAIDLLTLFNDPGHYHALVITRSWPEKAFTTWLAEQMRHNLLPTDAPVRRGAT